MPLFAWSSQAEQPDVLLSIIPAVLGYLDINGQWGKIPMIAQIGLEYAKLTGNLKTFTLISTHTMAWILSHQGCQDEAERYVIEAFDAARQMENIAWQCEVLIHYSQILRRSGRMDEALTRCREALYLAEGLYDPSMPFVRAEIEYELGKIARDKGDWQVSREHFLAARGIFRTDEENPSFNVEFAMGIYASLGFVSQQLGDLQAASQIYAHCLSFFSECGGKGFLATMLARVASLDEQLGNLPDALIHAHEALEWSKRLGMVQERAQAEAIIARLEGKSS
jgi:tetratricopeptide (TPR) repeat protein